MAVHFLKTGFHANPIQRCISHAALKIFTSARTA
jgi:hypothetical protein